MSDPSLKNKFQPDSLKKYTVNFSQYMSENLLNFRFLFIPMYSAGILVLKKSQLSKIGKKIIGTTYYS